MHTDGLEIFEPVKLLRAQVVGGRFLAESQLMWFAYI